MNYTLDQTFKPELKSYDFPCITDKPGYRLYEDGSAEFCLKGWLETADKVLSNIDQPFHATCYLTDFFHKVWGTVSFIKEKNKPIHCRAYLSEDKYFTNAFWWHYECQMIEQMYKIKRRYGKK